MSRGVRDHIRHLGSFRFEDLGEQQVKNIDRPVRAFRVIVGGRGRRHGADAARATGAVDLAAPPSTPTALLDLAMWQTVSDSDA